MEQKMRKIYQLIKDVNELVHGDEMSRDREDEVLWAMVIAGHFATGNKEDVFNDLVIGLLDMYRDSTDPDELETIKEFLHELYTSEI